MLFDRIVVLFTKGLSMTMVKNLSSLMIFIFLLTGNTLLAQSLSEIESNRINLPNGWRLTPAGN